MHGRTCYQHLFDINRFVKSAASAEVWALLNVILVEAVLCADKVECRRVDWTCSSREVVARGSALTAVVLWTSGVSSWCSSRTSASKSATPSLHSIRPLVSSMMWGLDFLCWYFCWLLGPAPPPRVGGIKRWCASDVCLFLHTKPARWFIKWWPCKNCIYSMCLKNALFSLPFYFETLCTMSIKFL